MMGPEGESRWGMGDGGSMDPVLSQAVGPSARCSAVCALSLLTAWSPGTTAVVEQGAQGGRPALSSPCCPDSAHSSLTAPQARGPGGFPLVKVKVPARP